MKYEKEIDQFLFDIIYEDWMSKDDYDYIINDVLNEQGISKQSLSNYIETGIKNGFTLETQFDIIKKIIKENK